MKILYLFSFPKSIKKISWLLLLFILLIFSISTWYAQQLKITEVYYDWTDERIEIYNNDVTDFSWEITISWARTSNALLTQSINISSWNLIVIADDLVTFINTWNIISWINKFSISDTQAITIDLLVSWVVIDNFYAPQTLVSLYNNAETSLELWSWQIQATTIDRSYNILGPILASPWYWDLGLLTVLGSGSWGQWSGSVWSWSWTPGTWSINTGLLASGLCMSSWSIIVEEFVYTNSSTPSYLELLATQPTSGILQLSWNIFSGQLPWAINIVMLSWDRIIVTNNTIWLFWPSVKYQQVFDFVQSWYLEVYIDNILVDYISIDVWTWSTLNSFYQSQDNWCYRLFSPQYGPSPGFDYQYLHYWWTTIVNQIIYQPDPNPLVCPINTSWSWWNNWSSTPNPVPGPLVTPTITSWFNWNINITLIDYDPPGSDINNERLWLLLDSWAQTLSLSWWQLIYDGKTYNFNTEVLTWWQEEIYVANFRFVNSRPICIDLSYQSIVYSTECYDPQSNASPFIPWSPIINNLNNTTPQSNTWNNQTPISWENNDTTEIDRTKFKLKLWEIVYDPPGSDTNNEIITIISNESFPIDLKDFRIRVSTTNKRIDQTIVANQTLVITKTRWLSNSKHTCIQLVLLDYIFDEKCYDPSLEKHEIDLNVVITGEILEDESDEVFSWLSLIWKGKYISWSLVINAVLPNPSGADKWHEYVELALLTGEAFIDLADWYQLLIKWKKFNLTWTIQVWSTIQVIWKFTLANTATCIDLLYDATIIDSFCYPKPKEWVIYWWSNDFMEKLEPELLLQLNELLLKKAGWKICVLYQWYEIDCKAEYKTKVSSSNSLELRIARAYIASFESVMKSSRYVLRKKTSLQNLSMLYREANKLAKKSLLSIVIDKVKVPLEDLELQYALLYNPEINNYTILKSELYQLKEYIEIINVKKQQLSSHLSAIFTQWKQGI